MTALSLFFSFSVFFGAGAGILLLLGCAGFRLGAFEFAALAWLLGTGAVSLALWVCGVFFLRGAALQFAVATIAATILATGWRGTQRNELPRLPRSLSAVDWTLGAIVVAEFIIFCLASYKHTLGWDGLMNWELKARYAFLNQGALPGEYFSGGGRAFTHPTYPLGIPFTELWVYLALGEANQFWAKSIFPIYYAAGTLLLASLASRITGQNWIGLLVAALLFITPQVTIGTGGAMSGYADFPLSAIYLAAVGFLVLSCLRNDPTAFRVYATCTPLLPWFKREGTVLWLIAGLPGAFLILRERQPRRLFALLPGVVLIGAWAVFSLVMRTVPSDDFLPVGAKMIAGIPHRVLLIGHAVITEVTDWHQWSLLWSLLTAAFAYLLACRRTSAVITLLWAVLAPIAMYSSTYLFSAWENFEGYLGTSLPRLLMHVAPLAWLVIATAIGFALKRAPTSDPSPLDARPPITSARDGSVRGDASRSATA